ncbi:MAG: hypothetical protein ABIN80_09525 [Dyadobacter sp.]|uniref:hypothetical protein n=1 Tax=Dyadobacter sp. TaxID=1914288 RepID=UPI0032642224
MATIKRLAKDFKQFASVTPNIILKEYAERPEIIVGLQIWFQQATIQISLSLTR